MSIKRVSNSNHAYERSKERFGLTKSISAKMIKNAYMHGIPVRSLPEGPVKDYLLKKQNRTRKRMKVYDNKVFIFASTSTACITAYPIPEDLIESARNMPEPTGEAEIVKEGNSYTVYKTKKKTLLGIKEEFFIKGK